jgi:predicted nuclease of predicted toxin-antitoxin system
MSRDADMALLAVRKVGDVCVVWVRLGNLPLRALLQRIAGQLHEVHEMLKTRSMRVIEIRDPPR